jgi:MoxR-like ATPase
MTEPIFPTDARPALPIEFRCTGCGRMLRTAAETAGRQAQCPQCATIVAIPATSDAIAGVPTEGDANLGAANPPLPVAQPPIIRRTGAAPSVGLAAPGSPQIGAWPGDVSAGAGGGMDVGIASIADGFHSPTGAPSHADGPTFRSSSPTALTMPSSPPAIPSVTSLSSSTMAIRPGASSQIKQLFDRIRREVGKIYVGQDELVLGTLVALFSGGHVLIESVPGLGKTLFVRTLGRVLGCAFGRIQFTADLMPSDITGAPIFDMKMQEFRFRPGPVFTQLLLADEINRSPAKTHAALLEIMQEYHVTVDGTSHAIERPFLVLATQNPIESEGTYNLPEAQLDRFMFKIHADYPAVAEEAAILKLHSQQVNLDRRLMDDLETIASPRDILAVTEECGRIRVDDRLIDYINSVVRLTRQWPQFHLGASPRAGIAMMQGARTLAAVCGRDYAVPDDVVQLALPALRHRVILTAEAEVEGHAVDALLLELIRTVEVPRI